MELNHASTCMCLQNYPKQRFLTVVVVIPKQLDVPICGRSPNPEHISDVFNTDPERPFESKSSLKSTEAPIFVHEKNHISCHWNHLESSRPGHRRSRTSGFLSGLSGYVGPMFTHGHQIKTCWWYPILRGPKAMAGIKSPDRKTIEDSSRDFSHRMDGYVWNM
jgi:hypothetical protein